MWLDSFVLLYVVHWNLTLGLSGSNSTWDSKITCVIPWKFPFLIAWSILWLLHVCPSREGFLHSYTHKSVNDPFLFCQTANCTANRFSIQYSFSFESFLFWDYWRVEVFDLLLISMYDIGYSIDEKRIQSLSLLVFDVGYISSLQVFLWHWLWDLMYLEEKKANILKVHFWDTQWVWSLLLL